MSISALRASRRSDVLIAAAFTAWFSAVATTSAFQIVKQPLLISIVGPAAYARNGPRTEANAQALFFVAWALASIPLGRLADRHGRAKVLAFCCSMLAAGSVLTALSTSLPVLFAARVVAGAAGGGIWGPAMSLVSESPRNAKRLGALGWVQTAVCFGHLYSAGANYLLAEASARFVFGACAVPAALGCAICWLKLEPPIPTLEICPGGQYPVPVRALSVGILLGFVGVAGSVHVGFWLPNLIASAFSQMAGADVRRLSSLGMLLLQAGALIGILGAVPVLSRFGQRGALLIYMAGSIAALVCVPYVATSLASMGCLIALLGLFATGLTGLLAAILPGLFSTGFRATGAGVSYNIGRIATGAQLAALGGMVATLGPRTGMAAGSLLYLVAGIPAAFLVDSAGKQVTV